MLDREQASRMLKLFPGSHTFQTIDESGRNCASLRRILHGTFEQCVDELEHYNSEGAAIFFTPNETDGPRRKKENVTAIRASFVDFDDQQEHKTALLPSLIVQSKNGEHMYWLLNTGEELSRFESVQRTLIAHLGSDPSITDLSRCMRVAGTLNLKDPAHPFKVHIKEMNNVRYTLDEILQVYPPLESKPALTNPVPAELVNDWQTILKNGVTRGSRHKTAVKLSGYLLRRFLHPDEVIEIMRMWNQRNQPSLSDNDLMQTINYSAIKEAARRKRNGVLDGN